MGKTYRYKDGELVLKSASESAPKPEPTPKVEQRSAVVDEEIDEYETMSRKELYAAAQEVDAERADWNMGRDEMLALVRGQ